MVALALRGSRRAVLVGAGVPLALICLVVVKNAVLFGVPGTSSWLGMNLAQTTISMLSTEERQQLVAEGKVSRYAVSGGFRPLEEYRPLLEDERARGIRALDQELKPSGAPNFNNIAYVAISNQLLRDGLTVVRHRPDAYADGLSKAIRLFFRAPSSQTFLRSNREEIGAWATLYSTIVYTGVEHRIVPLLLLAYAVGMVFRPRRGLRAFRPSGEDRAWSLTVFFVGATLLFVLLVANLIDAGENYRAEFTVEPLVLVVFALAIRDAWRWLGSRRLLSPARR